MVEIEGAYEKTELWNQIMWFSTLQTCKIEEAEYLRIVKLEV